MASVCFVGLNFAVYQSLIRTCSCVPLVEIEGDEDNAKNDTEEKKISYKDYMDIWAGLLDAPHLKVINLL